MCWEARLRFVAGYRNMLGRGCADDCKDESLPVLLLRRCEAFGRGECRESLHQVPVHVPFSCWRHFIADVGKRKKLTWVATLESIHALVPRHFAGPHNAKTLGVLKMEALAPDARELVDSFLGRSLSQLNEAYMKHIVEIVQDFQHNPASYLQKKVVKMRVVDLYKVLSERLAEADKLYRKDDGVRVDTPVKDQPPEFAALFEAPWTPNLDPDDPANASTSTIYRMPNLPSRPSPEPEASTSTSAGTAAQDDQEPEAGPSGHTRSQRSSSEPGPPAQDDPIPAFPPGAEASPSGQPPIDYSGFPSPVQNWGVFAQPTPNSSGHTEPSPPAQEDPILSLSQEHAAPSRQAEPSSSSTPVPEYVTGASGLFPAPTPGPSLQQQTQLFNFELAAQNAPIQAFSQEPEPTPSGHAPGLFSQALSPAQYDINDIPGLLFAPPTPSPSGYTYTESSNLPPPAQDGQGPEPSSPGQPEPSSPVKNVRGPLLAPAPDISGHTPHAEPSNLEPLFPQDQEPDLTLSGHTEPSNPGSPLSPGSQAIVESVWAQFGLVSPGPDISGHTPHAEPSNSGPLFPQDQEPDLTLSAHTEPSTPASPLSPGSQAIVKSVWAQFGLVAGPDISGHTPHAEPSHSGSSPQDDQQPDPTSSGHAVHSSFGSPPAPYGQQPDPAPSGHAAPSALGGPLRPISGHSPDSPPSPESQAMLDSALGLYSTLAPAPDISGDAEPFE